jgi:hypothetical protein
MAGRGVLRIFVRIRSHFDDVLGWALVSGGRFGLTNSTGGKIPMQDGLFIAITVVFFIVTIGYVRFCERVK